MPEFNKSQEFQMSFDLSGDDLRIGEKKKNGPWISFYGWSPLRAFTRLTRRPGEVVVENKIIFREDKHE